ncbi:acyl-CoA dehydrogenase family protein [uncultured Ferrovibrio sp.]|jgi:alkylation response protein AidB-like acyl-CoA dehydrogenase|uniref:acyl-CoA dehydrogenase family protein n=1 Tax=uncultured Ferrovibrio sp. TaxID=1576913 RepID=UPI002628DA97|nr:acyl-CoA dehydrogenase family protein [uncultured Ferrovibrio sp.]
MDFQLSEEQKLLADSVESWLQDKYDFERWRKLVKTDLGYAEENWKAMAELGWLAMPLPEEAGGLGGGAVECMLIAERFGKHLVAEPYLSTVVIGAGLILAAGSKAQQEEWLPQIAEGKAKWAFAFAEHGARFVLHEVNTAAKKAGEGWMISGKKIVVFDAPSADKLIVLARSDGAAADRQGLGLFVVDANGKGVTRQDYRTVDNRRASDIQFDNVPVLGVLGDPGNALETVEAVVDRAIGYLASEAVGAMQALYETTLAYLKTRKQFGRPIGDFQVLQHRMVDMMIHVESSRSLALLANLKADAAPAERAKAAAAAKVQIGKSGRWVGQQSIQLHGGMGMTDELNVGHYMKRLMMIDTYFGHADYHQRRFAALANAA